MMGDEWRWLIFLPFVLLTLVLAGWVILSILRQPVLGASFLIFFLPFERIPSWEVAGVTIRINHLIGGLTLLAWLTLLLLGRRKLVLPPSLFILGLFLASLVLSIIGAGDLGRAARVAIFSFFAISLGVLITQLVTRRAQLRSLFWLLGLSATIVCLFGAYQFVGDLAGLPASLTGLAQGYSKAVFGFPRLQSVALEPLYFGNFLLLPIGLGLAFFWVPQRWFARSKLILLLSLLLPAIILTLSRGAILGLASVLAVTFLILGHRRLSLRRVVTVAARGLVALIFLGAVFSWINPSATNRFLGHLALQDYSQSESIVGRLTAWQQALELWQASPLVGVGPGNFGPAVLGYPETPPVGGWPVVNNQYLEILAETGMLGLFFFIFFLIALLYRSRLALSAAQNDPEMKAAIVGLSAAVVGMLVQYNFFSTLYIVPVWVTFGLLMAVQSIALRGDAYRVSRIGNSASVGEKK